MTVPFNVRWLIVLSAVLFCFSCENGRPNKNKDTDQPLTDTQIADDIQNDVLSDDDAILGEPDDALAVTDETTNDDLAPDELLTDGDGITADDDALFYGASFVQWGSLTGYNTSNEEAVTVVIDAEGNRYLAGKSEYPLLPEYAGTFYSLFLASDAPDGSRRWLRQWAYDGCEEPVDMVHVPTDRSVLLGHGDFRGCLGLFGPDGAVEKESVLNFTVGAGFTRPAALLRLSSGALVVGGVLSGAWAPGITVPAYGEDEGLEDIFVALFSPDLELQWISRAGSSSADLFDVMTGATDGASFWAFADIAGEKFAYRFGQTGAIGETVALSREYERLKGMARAADGFFYTLADLGSDGIQALRWEEGGSELSLFAEWPGDNEPRGAVAAEGELVFVYAETTTEGADPSTHTWYRRYATQGAELALHDCGPELAVRSLAATADGVVHFAGSSGRSAAISRDAVAGSFAADGTPTVIDTVTAPGAFDQARDAIFLPDGTALIWGITTGDLGGGTPEKDGETILIVHAAGKEDRFFRFGTPGADSARSLARAPDGSIYLIGTTTGSFEEGSAGTGEERLFIIKLNADYERQWVREWPLADYGDLQDAATDGEGNLYLMGLFDLPDYVCQSCGGPPAGEGTVCSFSFYCPGEPAPCWKYYSYCNEHVVAGFSPEGDLLWKHRGIGGRSENLFLLRHPLGVMLAFSSYPSSDLSSDIRESDPLYWILTAEGYQSRNMFYAWPGLEMTSAVAVSAGGEIAVAIQTTQQLNPGDLSLIRYLDQDGGFLAQTGQKVVLTDLLYDGDGLAAVGMNEKGSEPILYTCPFDGACTPLYLFDSGGGNYFSSPVRGFSRDASGRLFLAGTTIGKLGERSFGWNDIYLLTFTRK